MGQRIFLSSQLLPPLPPKGGQWSGICSSFNLGDGDFGNLPQRRGRVFVFPRPGNPWGIWNLKGLFHEDKNLVESARLAKLVLDVSVASVIEVYISWLLAQAACNFRISFQAQYFYSWPERLCVRQIFFYLVVHRDAIFLQSKSSCRTDSHPCIKKIDYSLCFQFYMTICPTLQGTGWTNQGWSPWNQCCWPCWSL